VHDDPLLAPLDERQREAVLCPPTPTIVHAGAGSGKTRVLTVRIARRVAEGTARADHVLAITFTRESAGELRRRLAALGVMRHGRPTIGTFHATALSLLRRHSDGPAPVIAHNRTALAVAAAGRHRLASRPRDLLVEIDWAHARMVAPADYPRAVREARREPPAPAAEVAELYARYVEVKRTRQVADFDDLIARSVDRLRDDADFAAAVRWQFRHLFVDEAQDMNPLQWAMLAGIRGDNPDVFLVGDPLQAIYGWNGADRARFDALPDVLPGATTVVLPRNYRCSGSIVAAARHIAAQTSDEVRVEAVRESGRSVELLGLADEHEEVRAICALVDRAQRRGWAWSDVAVLVRTNAQVAPIAGALAANGVPVASAVRSAAMASAISSASECTGRERLAAWAADAEEDGSNGAEREVAAMVRAFLLHEPRPDGRSFAAWASATHDASPAGGVSILTFHAAKGREWRYVIVAGAEEGLVPHRAIASGPLAEEEIRLAYVAFTRAADALTVTWTERRGTRRTGPSRLLEGLPTTDGSAVDVDDATRTVQKIRSRTAAADPDAAIRTALAAWRRDLARATEQDPSTICSDADLERLIRLRPGDVDALSAILPAPVARRLAPRLLPLLAGRAG